MKLLIASSGNVHTVNFYHLIKDYFDEVLVVTNVAPGDETIKYEKVHYGLKNPVSVVSNINRIKKIIQDFAPDIIHAHQVNSVSYLVIKAKPKHIPLVVTAWGSDILTNTSDGLLKKQMVKHILEKADFLTSDSTYMAEKMRGLLPSKQLDITIANFGITVDPKKVDKENWIYSNRNHEPLYKIDAIITEFANFCKTNSDWKLVIAGRGSQTEAFKQQVKQLGIEDKVEFAGWLNKEQNQNYYNRSKLFVSIPESDATSISLLEAMACGCAPVVSDLPANHEWIKDGQNGIIVKVGETGFIQRALQLDLNKAAEQNAQIIQEHGTKEANRQKFIELYKKASA